MRIIVFLKKVIKYINEKIYNDFLETMGMDQEGITEEEAKILFYYIDHYDEIQEKYGSFSKWEKSMKMQQS